MAISAEPARKSITVTRSVVSVFPVAGSVHPVTLMSWR